MVLNTENPFQEVLFDALPTQGSATASRITFQKFRTMCCEEQAPIFALRPSGFFLASIISYGDSSIDFADLTTVRTQLSKLQESIAEVLVLESTICTYPTCSD